MTEKTSLIITINDLRRYGKQILDEYPALDREQVLLEKPGVSSADIGKLLHAIPGVPDKYLEVLKSYRLYGVSIGYYQPWPLLHKSADIVDSLISKNMDSENPIRSLLDAYSLMEVGHSDGEWICIAKEGEVRKGGDVWSISVYDELEPMAESFEQFLILAGNLNQVNRKYSLEDRERALEDMSARLRSLDVPESMRPYWLART